MERNRTRGNVVLRLVAPWLSAHVITAAPLTFRLLPAEFRSWLCHHWLCGRVESPSLNLVSVSSLVTMKKMTPASQGGKGIFDACQRDA